MPTSDEYNALNTHLGTNAGQKMKETGFDHWDDPNTGATNEYGFTALPAGLRAYNNGTFSSVGVYNYLWVSDSNGSNATFWYLNTNSTLFRTSSTVKTYGFSVRCLED